jgi:hypothetical protein
MRRQPPERASTDALTARANVNGRLPSRCVAGKFVPRAKQVVNAPSQPGGPHLWHGLPFGKSERFLKSDKTLSYLHLARVLNAGERQGDGGSSSSAVRVRPPPSATATSLPARLRTPPGLARIARNTFANPAEAATVGARPRASYSEHPTGPRIQFGTTRPGRVRAASTPSHERQPLGGARSRPARYARTSRRGSSYRHVNLRPGGAS